MAGQSSDGLKRGATDLTVLKPELALVHRCVVFLLLSRRCKVHVAKLKGGSEYLDVQLQESLVRFAVFK
jgi:hypothetical protein